MSSPEALDLLVRARRDLLSKEEKVRLDVALAEAPEHRLLLRAGIEFDAEASALPGDEQLVARIADRVVKASSVAPERAARAVLKGAAASRSARRGSMVLTAVLSLVMGGLAGAAVGGTYWSLGAPRSTSDRALPAQAKPARLLTGDERLAPAKTAVAEPIATAPLRVPVPPQPTLSTTRAPRQLRAGPSVAETVAATDGGTAAELYRSANQMRVRGDTRGAIGLYLELQTRFAGSKESTASLLTLANLYLMTGDPALALAKFRAHQAAGDPSFGAESLWGMAVALHRLGRYTEERDALLALTARYPGSAYESAARRKLDAGE